MDLDVHMRRVIDNLSVDLNSLSSESKRKFTPVKEASEACLLKLRQINSLKSNLYKTLCDSSLEIIQPLIIGCDTKQPKIIQICLMSVQKIIEAKILNLNSGTILIDTLWQLTDAGLEELRVLQTIILIVNTTEVVKHTLLAKTLSIGLRLCASKDATIMHTANAMVSQMITAIFERVLIELETKPRSNLQTIDLDKLKTLVKDPPETLGDSARDAFMLFQDMYLLLNSDQPLWLLGVQDINKPFGLELLKTVLVKYYQIFFINPEMLFLLKERICPLLIKLFSPSTKLKVYSQTINQSSSASSTSSTTEKNYFLIIMRLIRIVHVLIKYYFELLVTENEIFLSLIIKFLDFERPMWQKTLAIELFHKISCEAQLIRLFCVNYDMKPHTEKILSGVINSLTLFTHQLFINQTLNPTSAQQGNAQQQQQQSQNNKNTDIQLQNNTNLTAFLYKDVYISLLLPYVFNNLATTQNLPKEIYLDTWDKYELPTHIQETYLLSICFSTLQDFIRSVQYIFEIEIKQSVSPRKTSGTTKLSQSPECLTLVSSSYNCILFIYNLFLETCIEEVMTDNILKSIKIYTYLCSLLALNKERDAFVCLMCRNSLPANYSGYVINTKLIDTHITAYINSNSSKILNLNGSNNTATRLAHHPDEQVIAIGPPLANINGQNLYLTAKHIQIMKFIIQMSQIYGDYLGNSWYLVLNTLQNLTWILNLKPVNANTNPNTANNQLINPQAAVANTTATIATDWSLLKHVQTTPAAINENLITTSVQNEITQICVSLTKLFEFSKELGDETLNDIVDALIQLSKDCIEVQNLGKTNEPCLFAIVKLYETSISNMHRINLIWYPVTEHLIELCKHPNLKLREWCVDSICLMIKFAFNYNKFDKSLNEDHELKQMFLLPLQELSLIQFNDIRQKQLECTLTILRLMGQYINYSWPLCLTIIGSINKDQTEVLIRSAFQCLQLVVTDFLSMMSVSYLSLVISVVAKFGFQEQDLSISLTAIVLLWNISDYMFQNCEQLVKELDVLMKKSKSSDESKNEKLSKLNLNVPLEHKSIESIWMILYTRLGELCVDPRPAVRKSAGQTLFCTISSHSSVLSEATWQSLVNNVLFSLLEQVRANISTASKERDASLNNTNFLMHHSRDTAEKQWAETCVLTLAGVTRVFNAKCNLLIKLNDFQKLWLKLLEYIENSVLAKNNEICLAALRSFHELLGNQNYYSSPSSSMSLSSTNVVAAAATAAAAATTTSNSSSNTSLGQLPSNAITQTSPIIKYLDISQWLAAWKVCLNIGMNISYDKQQINQINELNKARSNRKGSDSQQQTAQQQQAAFYTSTQSLLPPSQTFLTCYVDLIPIILDVISFKFSKKDFETYSTILEKLLSIPVVGGDFASFVFVQGDNNLTPLQTSCLNSIKNFIKISKSSDSFAENFIPLVFQRLLTFSTYACYNPQLSSTTAGSTVSTTPIVEKVPFNANKSTEMVSINFVPFGEKCLTVFTSLYEESAEQESVVENQIFKSIVKTLYIPLSLKYACPSASTWKLAIECLLRILKKGLPIAFRKNNAATEAMWLELAKLFEDFLFTKNTASAELTIEVIQKDEMIDCQLIELIRDEILAYSNSLPAVFTQKLLNILNRGSIYSNTTESFLDIDSSRKLREEFSKTCFETLLRFSFISNSNDSSNDAGLTRMALSSMLNRCKEIIQHYANDERLNGSVPLPRARTNEMICVLKSLCTLISSLKKAPKDAVQSTIWNQVIGLYPCLVECTTSPSNQICVAVKDALHHYFSLLTAPSCT